MREGQCQLLGHRRTAPYSPGAAEPLEAMLKMPAGPTGILAQAGVDLPSGAVSTMSELPLRNKI